MPILATIAVLALLIAGMRLSERLGYPFWYGGLLAVPVVNLIVLGFFAFRVSPHERRIAELEAELAATQQQRLAGTIDGSAAE